MKSRLIGMTAALVVLTACGASSTTAAAETPPNTNPKAGWVVVRNNGGGALFKVCDGSTLVYAFNSNGGLAVIANSPECS
ncbi:MAG TPA: hypothetical protein PKV96_01455 [Candidatus Saccharimonas sp.]|nr:hypothetical protein [Candidatus Saccharimonas sp.]